MSVPCNRISLLYVDDEQNLLDLCKLFLEREGEFTVFTITSAKEALKILDEGRFEVIISDYQMPEMDGIELLKSIRSRYPDLPFIIFTGKGREEVVIQAIDAGADYYVQKGNDIRSQFRELSYKIKLAVEKRHVDTALKASEERFRSVVEDQTEFICRFTPDGKLTFVNDAYCRYFGLDKSSSVGAPQSVVIPLDDLQQMKQHLHSLTPENPVATIEHRIVMPVGEIRWQQWSDRAIYDVKGNIIEYQSVGHDITHRKTAELDLRKKNDELHAAYEQLTAIEEELRTNFEDLVKSQHALQESEQRYRNVVEDQTEFICRFKPEGTHNFVNDAYCRHFGMQRLELIGRRFIPEIPKEDRRLLRSYFASLTGEHPVGTIEHRIILPDGSARWHQWSDRAIFDEYGTLVEYQSVGRDITDWKTVELDLRKKNDELRRAYEQLIAR